MGQSLTYDGDLVPLGDIEDLPQMGRREDGAAGVGGRVDDDGRGVVVDQRLHVGEVDPPVLVGEEVVLPGLDAQAGGQGGVEREAGARHQDVLAVVRQGRDGDVEGAGAAGAEDHVLLRHLAPWHADVLGHGRPRLHRAGARAVPGGGN